MICFSFDTSCKKAIRVSFESRQLTQMVDPNVFELITIQMINNGK
jgi:hypothetical protein